MPRRATDPLSPRAFALAQQLRKFSGTLKRRLLRAGLKQPICELCGQGETWRGNHMSLVLDHINGVPTDHRLENLRMVCPNCAATLETHCWRNSPRERVCPGCGQTFFPHSIGQRYCSQTCWGVEAATRYRGVPHPELRKVRRRPTSNCSRMSRR